MTPILVLLVSIRLTQLLAASCNTESNVTGPENLLPINTSAPVFIRRVKNGELYRVGSSDDEINLVHLWGNSGYDFGYAYGSLLKDEIEQVIQGFWNYMVNEVVATLNNTRLQIPNWFLNAIARIGIEGALEIQNSLAKPFMLDAWYDEMKGLADSTGLAYNRIVQVHMLAELTRGRCSFYGITGNAAKDNKILQLRALDWDTNTGIQNHPTIVIYHPIAISSSNTRQKNIYLGHPFANIGWAGVIMTLSGISSARLGISEIGISYPDDSFGDEVSYGIPFTFLERKLLQFATSIHHATDIISNANRTCRLVLGLADANLKEALLVQYSHSIVQFYNYSNLQPNTWYHQRIQDIVYLAMDWTCPYYQNLMQTQLNAMWGQITPQLSIQNISAPVQTGDLHCCVYDLTDQVIYVANARGDSDDPQSPLEAYQRQFVRINLSSLWDLPYNYTK